MSASTSAKPDDQIPGLHSGVDTGEYLEIAPDPDQIEIEDAPDGGAWVNKPVREPESAPPDAQFYANLADEEILPRVVQDRIVIDLLERIEDDKKARELRDKQYEEGLRRSGLGNDAPGGAQFQGASKAVHPMISEACVDFAARIMKEAYPPSGPVKPKIMGTVTKEKEEKAKRKTEHMNYQITTQIKEARAVLETTFTQVPLGGSQFIHQWWDHRLKRPRWEFRSVDKMYLPFSAADFASSHRRTFADNITAVTFKQRVDQGMYVDIDASPGAARPEESKTEKANAKIEGVSDSGQNKDDEREIYECMTYLEVSEEMADALKVEKAGELCPYLITIDVQSKRIAAMYRCWEDGDEAREPIEYDFEFPFLPWRGALSIGLPQLIGGLSAAATGALRALLDSAHVNNIISGFIKKGAHVSGQSREPNPGELMEIDTGLETPDIKQAILLSPFNPPSAVLFQLLGFVVDAAKGLIRTSLDETPNNGGAPVPVGTQMSRVEEGLVVFSAIHGRQHAALNRLLAGLHRLNRLYLPEVLKVDAAGQEIMVRRSDYEGPCDVQPVSDPTIYSDQQRWNQLAYIQSRMMANPSLWKARAVELAGLKLCKYPDPESLLVDVPQPMEMNQVSECLAMALGKPVEVFPEQDHMAHLQVLLDWIKSPMIGQSPLIAPIFLPGALKHAAQHIAYALATRTLSTLSNAAGKDVKEMMDNDDAVKRAFDGALAIATTATLPTIEANLAGAMQIIQQAMALAKSLIPPPPMDPSLAAVQAAGAETSRKAQADKAGTQIDAQKLALQQQQNAIQADRVAAMRENTQVQAQARLQQTQMDNATAEDISSAKIASGSPSGYKNGESLTGA